MKTAVVLLNLGGPLKQEDIRPFLYNFFMDENIIAAPRLVRWMIAAYIAQTRSRGAAKAAYGHLGYKSPLLENTEAQARALDEKLGENFKVFTAMRYWHPFADEAARGVKAFGPDRIVLLPLYPQFSTATSRSAFADWARAAKAAGLADAARRTCCWFVNPGFISASAARIKDALATAPDGVRVLFSAHGLPEKLIRTGDPYQWQCEQTAAAIVKKLGLPGLDWEICYQSRVGPLKWIGPSTEEVLKKAAKDGKGVVIYPHAFVSEHVETLVEIGIEYREMAEKLGLPYFGRAETVGTHPDFIAGLAEIARGAVQADICPAKFACCGNDAKEKEKKAAA